MSTNISISPLLSFVKYPFVKIKWFIASLEKGRFTCTSPHWFKNFLETFFKAILGTDLGQVCTIWVNLAPEHLKLTSFHGQIDQ